MMRHSLISLCLATIFVSHTDIYADDTTNKQASHQTTQTQKTAHQTAQKTTSKQKVNNNPSSTPTKIRCGEPPSPSTPSGIDRQWLDTQTRPQDDFFRFMSGKWLDHTAIPSDKGRYGAFDQLRDLSLDRIHAIVEEISSQHDVQHGSNADKIKKLYDNFMGEALIQEQDIQPLHNDFNLIDNTTQKNLATTLAQLARMGITGPTNVFVSQDAKDPSQYKVIISQSGLSLPDRDYYLKDDTQFKTLREAYLSHISNMLGMAGIAKDEAQAKQMAKAVLDFETAIAKIQWSNVKNRDPVKTYNKIALADFYRSQTQLNWPDYFKEMGVISELAPFNDVIVRQPTYVQDLEHLLKTTSLTQVQAYLKWRTLNAYAAFLSKRFVEQDFSFYGKTVRGIPENAERWKRGIGLIEDSMGEALGEIYVRKHFPPEYKARMQTLVSNLLLAYKDSIQNLTWMSETTKKEALTKLSKFTSKIAYPEKWRDYTKLTIYPNELVRSVKSAREFNYERMIKKLGKPVDKTEWGMTPQTVNAYYNPRQNEIVFPAAILMPPFFNPDADDAVNYGGIGAVIGHEISHGFDDSGSQSDGDGVLRDWWTAEDKANFKKLADGIVAQYNGYSPVAGYHLNGKLTLGENIADNSGLAIAYKAYQISLNGKPAPVIDGYTGNQRLFMGWGQVWRGKARDAEAIRLIATDPHSPSQFRANGPLTNIQGFYDAFGVKAGDKMYTPLEKRISIW